MMANPRSFSSRTEWVRDTRDGQQRDDELRAETIFDIVAPLSG